MPKIVCVECQTELRPETNGTTVFEMASFGIYKLWDADTWKCPGCEYEVVAGFGQQPIMEHYQDGFYGLVDRVKSSGNRFIYDFERQQANPFKGLEEATDAEVSRRKCD